MINRSKKILKLKLKKLKKIKLPPQEFPIIEEISSEFEGEIKLSENRSLIILKKKEKIIFEGSFSYILLKGTFEIFGSLINQIEIQDLDLKNNEIFINKIENHFSESIISEFSDIKLNIECVNTNIEQKNEKNQLIFLKLLEIFNKNDNEKSFWEKNCIIYIKKNKDFYINNNLNSMIWNFDNLKIIKEIVENSKNFPFDPMFKTILIFGEKNSGKSFFSTFLINKLLNNNKKIYYLETDLGQNNYFIPGTISLTSFDKPILTNNSEFIIKKPDFFNFIGEFTPLNFLENYLKSIKNMINTYKIDFKNSFLIINTHGFLSNYGENILIDILKISKPYWIIGMGKSYNNLIEDFLENKKKDFFNFKINLIENQDVYDWKYQFFQIYNNENWTINKSKINFNKRKKRDIKIFNYLSLNNENKIIESKFFHKNALSFENFNLLTNTIEIKFDKIKIFLMKSLNELQKIQNKNDILMLLPYCLISLYDSECVIEKLEDLSRNNCLGIGFIKDICVEENKLIIISNLNNIDNIGYIIKSNEYSFGNSFPKENYEKSIIYREIIDSLENYNCQNEKDRFLPFELDGFHGIGSIPYAQKVSLKKSR